MLELPLSRDLDLDHILELHYSYLHHIPNIVIFYLDMIRLVMEHRVLQKLHKTLVAQYIQVASNWRSNKSDNSFLSHTTPQLAEQVVTNSASAVLSATQDCFLLNQEITPNPILKQHPEVLFLLMALPTQSKSIITL